MITVNTAIYDLKEGKDTYSLVVKPTKDGDWEWELCKVDGMMRVTVQTGLASDPRTATLTAMDKLMEV